MICYCNKQTTDGWPQGYTRSVRKTAMDPLMIVKHWIGNFLRMQRKRKRLIKGLINGELVFEIGIAFGGLCRRLS